MRDQPWAPGTHRGQEKTRTQLSGSERPPSTQAYFTAEATATTGASCSPQSAPACDCPPPPGPAHPFIQEPILSSAAKALRLSFTHSFILSFPSASRVKWGHDIWLKLHRATPEGAPAQATSVGTIFPKYARLSCPSSYPQQSAKKSCLVINL